MPDATRTSPGDDREITGSGTGGRPGPCGAPVDQARAALDRVSNPVVRGVAPDPSACRVGADYFLVTSSLEFWPGLPLRHSTDLQTWTTIGHAVTRPAQYRRDGLRGPLKLYAATLRHDGSRFWLACTNVAPGQGNFLLSAEDPAGPWSDAVWLDADGFDPSLTFDGSRTYYTRRTVVPGRQGSGPVVQAEIDVTTGAFRSEPRAVTPDPAGYRSNDIEGPHLYRVGDWWYLFSAEGGTWKGHMQTVARSRSPWGPFEGCPRNPVLTHRHRVGHPIQSTGHADLLDDVNGHWWAVLLGTRHDGPVPWHHLGRETFLAPVIWGEDGWPVLGDDGTLELDQRLPRPRPPSGPSWPHRSSPWTSGWSTRAEPLPGLRLTQPRGTVGVRVELPATDQTLDDEGAAAAVFLRQREFEATFSATLLDVPPEPGWAGIAVYAAPAHHYDLTAALGHGGRRVTLRKRVGDLVTHASVTVPGSGALTLRIGATATCYDFSVRDAASPDGPWQQVGTGLVRLLAAETTQAYSGARFAALAAHHAAVLTVP